MNKKEFTKYIREQMEGMTYEQRLKLLRRIEGDYVPTLIKGCMQKEGYYVPPEKAGEYTKCEKCEKYSLKKACKADCAREVVVETTYTDAGYGDDDMMGEVEYFVEYSTCPHCNHKQEINRMCMRIISEWNRREGRK